MLWRLFRGTLKDSNDFQICYGKSSYVLETNTCQSCSLSVSICAQIHKEIVLVIIYSPECDSKLIIHFSYSKQDVLKDVQAVLSI